MESLIKRLSNIVTVIILSPLLLVAACGLTIYWVCKFPFWYIERKGWWRNHK